MSSATAHPADISSKGWLALLKRVFSELSDDHVGLIAAGCAFYGLLAIFPGLVAAMAIAGLFTDPNTIVTQLETLTRFVPAEAAQIVIDQAKSVAGSDSGGLGLAAVIGLLTAFYSATAGMAALIEGLNVAFDVKEPRSFLRTLMVKGTLTLGLIAGFFGIVILLVAIPVILGLLRLPADTEWFVMLVRWPLVLLVVAGGLAVLYRYGPARTDRRWRWVTPGAAAACILWLVGSLAFGFYASNFGSYNETFGALGGVIILLMWLWLSAYIVLLGAEIDSEIEAQAKQDPKPARADPGTADADLLESGQAQGGPAQKNDAGAKAHPTTAAAQPEPVVRKGSKLSVGGIFLLAGAALFAKREN
ncbi:YihY/virulence factor BrkB family protein [Loktanella salsilacus]|uniref:YihY/virulence factor BrkB family protein n=1 Tax=Loktanella salsilacus TaxID=195913 RepID=UPI0037363978